MWQFATRRVPFVGLTPTEIFVTVQRGGRPAWDNAVLPLDDGLRSLATDCWGVDPTDRPVLADIIAVLNDMIALTSKFQKVESRSDSTV
jgi:hypothetical protein